MKAAVVIIPRSGRVVFYRLCREHELRPVVVAEYYGEARKVAGTDVEFIDVPVGCENRVEHLIKETSATSRRLKCLIRRLKKEQRP